MEKIIAAERIEDARAYWLLLVPGTTLLALGLLLHPLAPQDAFSLLLEDACTFLLRAGFFARCLLLAGAALIVASVLAVLLASWQRKAPYNGLGLFASGTSSCCSPANKVSGC